MLLAGYCLVFVLQRFATSIIAQASLFGKVHCSFRMVTVSAKQFLNVKSFQKVAAISREKPAISI